MQYSNINNRKISVIIPCFNVADYLDRCWQSIKRQSIGLENIECLFVNDSSTDDGATLNKLTEIEAQSPNTVTVIDLQENVGPGEARNVAIHYACGEYIQFLDADDELHDNALKLLYDTAKENDADIVQYNHLYILGNQRKSSQNSNENKLYIINSKEDRLPFLNSSTVTYGCTNKLIRRELILRSEARFPARLKYEEPLFIYPLFFYANRVYKLKEDLYFYYFRQGSMVTSELGKKLFDHPKVQLMLLEYCLEHADVYNEYKDIFEIYFLWSFYLETISFAGSYNNAQMPLEFFLFMQEICRKYCTNWKENPYLSMLPESGRKALDSINRVFRDQLELDQFLSEAKDCI